MTQTKVGETSYSVRFFPTPVRKPSNEYIFIAKAASERAFYNALYREYPGALIDKTSLDIRESGKDQNVSDTDGKNVGV